MFLSRRTGSFLPGGHRPRPGESLRVAGAVLIGISESHLRKNRVNITHN